MIIGFLALITLASCSRFCFYSFSSSPFPSSSPTPSPQPFRSYHPHYLHSFSYPRPSTLHLYFGRVQFSHPLFLIQQAFESLQTPLLLVNNKPRYLTSSFHLDKTIPKTNINQFMLVLAIQNSYTNEDGEYEEESVISLRKEKEVYTIVMRNGTEVKGYVLYFTGDGSGEKRVGVGIRDVGGKNTKENWRLSRNLRWKDGEKEISIVNSTGIAIQIDTTSLPTLANFKIHFKQVPLLPSSISPHDTIAHTHDRLHPSPSPSPPPAQTCQTAAANRLLAGLSFQHGNLRIVNNTHPIPNTPRSLLSFTPSRKRFPWGFLWDDGFHNEIAIRYNPALSLQVLKSWFSTLISGWIPREQNRGKQRQELCNCQPFMNKDIKDGNPPTLILPISYAIRNRLFPPETIKTQLWGELQEWYDWYMRTQQAKEPYLFKWFDHIRGEGSFNSGMDDFPRLQPTMYHVDAQGWMYGMARVMEMAAEYVGDREKKEKFQEDALKIRENLGVFRQPQSSTLRDVADSFASTVYSSELGYPSLIPLAFGMLDCHSPQYNATLDLITNPAHLNTTFGLSSISQSSPRYLQNNNAYWRGPVWININYLVARGLKLYYPQETTTYNNLRTNLLTTVCGEFNRSGYFFENYVNGSGNRLFSYPFNGWTSLISIISSENF